MQEKVKKIPSGLSDFKELKLNNYYYVDKTKYISFVEDNSNKYIFFLRPQRFGKSLLISTFANYYDVNKKDKFDEIFKDTYIGNNPTPLKNSYYILRFDFSKIGTSDKLEVIEQVFNKNIYDTIHDFYVYYEEIMGGERSFKEDFSNILTASSSLSSFISVVNRKKIKLYILIDEYDNFANNLLMDKGERDYISITHGTGFFRGFFTAIKAGTSSCIDRFFITGVSQLVLSDVTSGMNIGENISFRDKFNSMTGFNDKEIEELLEYYINNDLIKREDKDKIKRIFKSYYNNYCFSEKFDERVCNSSMIFYFLNEYIERKKIPMNLVDMNFSTDYEKLKFMILKNRNLSGNFDVFLSLLVDGKIESELKRSFLLERLDNTEEFVSLLYYLGLVTVKEINEFEEYVFIIPNDAVRHIEYDYIVKALDDVMNFKDTFYLDIAKEFKKMAVSGQWQEAIKTLIDMYYEHSSLRDLTQKELALKIFVFALLSLDRYHSAQSEVEFNRGYVDIYLKLRERFKDVTKYEYLMEFKYIKANEEVTKERIEALRAKAIGQLNQYEESDVIKESKEAGKEVKKIVVIGSSQKLELLEEV